MKRQVSFQKTTVNQSDKALINFYDNKRTSFNLKQSKLEEVKESNYSQLDSVLFIRKPIFNNSQVKTKSSKHIAVQPDHDSSFNNDLKYLKSFHKVSKSGVQQNNTLLRKKQLPPMDSLTILQQIDSQTKRKSSSKKVKQLTDRLSSLPKIMF